MPELQSTSDVIDALGGPTKVARLLGDGYSTQRVWNWKQADNFPPETFVALREALKAHRASAPPSLWRMVKPEKAAS